MKGLFVPKEAWEILRLFSRESRGFPLYLVGGFIRDTLLGRCSHDLDLLVFDDPKELLKRVGIPFFALDKERKIYRSLWKEYRIDLSAPRRETLEGDLLERDFTINAMAYPLRGKERIIDPWRGLEDLRNRVVRVVAPWALESDPLRILRAFRLSQTLGFKISADTVEYCEKGASLLNKVAKERIGEEMALLLAHPFSFRAFYEMKRWKILEVLLPEMCKGRGILHGKWRGADLEGHLLYTLKSLEEMIAVLSFLFPLRFADLRGLLMSRAEGEHTYLTLLKLSALVHDIGKPRTMLQRGDDVTFWGHDKEGSKMAKEIAERVALGRKATAILERLVAHHMWLHLLARGGEISRKAQGRFFRRLGREGVLLVLLSLSDSLASSGQYGFFHLLPFARELLTFYYSVYLKEESMQKPILDGEEVMRLLYIKPGPKVGEVLSALLDAQMAGEVKTRGEAIEYVKRRFSLKGPSH